VLGIVRAHKGALRVYTPLERHGHSVILAPDGISGIQRFRRCRTRWRW
jgi:hypothetical protein